MQRQGPAGFLKKKFKNKLTDNKLKRTEIVLTLYGSHTSLFLFRDAAGGYIEVLIHVLVRLDTIGRLVY
jgi:hypothetical protein